MTRTLPTSTCQLSSIHAGKGWSISRLEVLTDTKEQEKAIRYLVQMYFGLEERYKRTHSNKNPGGQYF